MADESVLAELPERLMTHGQSFSYFLPSQSLRSAFFFLSCFIEGLGVWVLSRLVKE